MKDAKIPGPRQSANCNRFPQFNRSPFSLGYVYKTLDFRFKSRAQEKQKTPNKQTKNLSVFESSEKIMLLSEVLKPKWHRFWDGCWT